jgi:hypothetical protein
MSETKKSLKEEFISSGDIRVILDLIQQYKYTDEEVGEVINIYEPYTNNQIPEVEHIEVLLQYFPNSKVSEETMNAIKCGFPNEYNYIKQLQNQK